MAKAKEKQIEEKQRENARSNEIEEIRRANARGLEKRRADGGVSFLYDQPQIVEKYQEERDKRLKEIEKVLEASAFLGGEHPSTEDA